MRPNLVVNPEGPFSTSPFMQHLVMPQRPQGNALFHSYASSVAGSSTRFFPPLGTVHQNALPPVGTSNPRTSSIYTVNPLFFHNVESEKIERMPKEDMLPPNDLQHTEVPSNHNANPDKGKEPYTGLESDTDLNPDPSTENLRGVTIASHDLAIWHNQLQHKVVLGLCHGLRPPIESLKTWISSQWETRNIMVSHVQYLPNNYYLFIFYDVQAALWVVSHGQWIIKNTPMTVFNWYPGFDPKGPKPSKVPVWVDFVDLPIEFYPWLKIIGACIGRVLGQRASKGINPKWDPQLLIEIDPFKDLQQSIPIKNFEGNR
ncbi:hypothetical protein L7F22_033097 [Adiantum nelumboides]|nr:hypothetical protein [Adiantum nelumboides]